MLSVLVGQRSPIEVLKVVTLIPEGVVVFMKTIITFFISVFVFCVACERSIALNLGVNITQFDGNANYTGGSSYKAWYTNVDEDQEVEPNTSAKQKWDLEGFFLDDSMLSMVGGFDFARGVLYGNTLMVSGDLFIDVDGNSANGYEYAYDLQFSGPSYTYSLYTGFTIDNKTALQFVTTSGPWAINTNGLTSVANGTFGYYTNLANGAVSNLLGDAGGTNSHNAVQIDLSYFFTYFAGSNITLHFTMSCGNDNLMGGFSTPYQTPDGGMSIMFLGFSFFSLESFRRRVRPLSK